MQKQDAVIEDRMKADVEKFRSQLQRIKDSPENQLHAASKEKKE